MIAVELGQDYSLMVLVEEAAAMMELVMLSWRKDEGWVS